MNKTVKRLWNNLYRLFYSHLKIENIFHLAFLTFLGAAVRIYFLLFSPSITYYNDGLCRLHQARQWLVSCASSLPSETWLPFHYLLLLLLTPLGIDVAVSGKIVTTILGIATIPLFYSLCCNIFNRSIAFWAAMLLALNGFHIQFGAMYMSEVPFLFFIVLAFWAMHRFFVYHKIQWFFISVAAANAYSMIRFEGWVLLFLFALYVAYYTHNIKLTALFAILGSLSIVLFCGYMYNTIKVSPLIGITGSDIEVAASYNAYKGGEIAMIKNYLLMLPIFPHWIFTLLALGIVMAIYKRHKLSYLLVFTPLLLLSIYKMFTFSLLPSWRYFSIPLLMLLPYAIIPIAALCAANKSLKVICIPLVFLVTYPSIKNHYKNLSDNGFFIEGFDEVCGILKKKLTLCDYVFAELKGDNYCAWQEKIGMVKNNYYRPHDAGMKYMRIYEPFTKQVAQRIICDSAYKFIFFQKQSEHYWVVNDSSMWHNLHLKGIGIDTLYNSNIFFLAEIKRHQ